MNFYFGLCKQATHFHSCWFILAICHRFIRAQNDARLGLVLLLRKAAERCCWRFGRAFGWCLPMSAEPALVLEFPFFLIASSWWGKQIGRLLCRRFRCCLAAVSTTIFGWIAVEWTAATRKSFKTNLCNDSCLDRCLRGLYFCSSTLLD